VDYSYVGVRVGVCVICLLCARGNIVG